MGALRLDAFALNTLLHTAMKRILCLSEIASAAEVGDADETKRTETELRLEQWTVRELSGACGAKKCRVLPTVHPASGQCFPPKVPRSGCAPLVSVVKAAYLRNRNHSSQLHRLHRSRFGRIFGQRQMSPGSMIICQERCQVPVQGSLAKHDQPSRPGEFRPEPLTDSGHEPLDSSGSCHPEEACRLPPRQEVRPVAR